MHVKSVDYSSKLSVQLSRVNLLFRIMDIFHIGQYTVISVARHNLIQFYIELVYILAV
jgi:hypothetical protein